MIYDIMTEFLILFAITTPFDKYKNGVPGNAIPDV